jgi:triphosphatase
MKPRPTETELKFRVGEDVLARLLDHPALQGPEHVAHLRSVYFDTPARDLGLSGLSLRVRDTGEGYIQTVKQRDGAGGFTRGEWEVKVPAEALDLAALSKTPVEKVLKGKFAGLEPVFATTAERLVRSCRKGASLIEVGFDSGNISAGERSEPVHELELELKEGDVSALFTLGRALVLETSIGLSFESKADRGYRVLNQTQFEPRLPGDLPCSSDASASELFRQIARGCLAQAVANADLFRAVQRPEAVHQMRVGLRRLGAALAAFKPMLLDDKVTAIDGELKWFTAELDTARDLDVFIEGVFRPAAEIADGPDFASLGRQLLKAQTAGYERAMAAVRSGRYAIMIFDAATWIETGPWGRLEGAGLAGLRNSPAKTFAADALDRLYRRACKRGRKFSRLDPGERHKLRIRAKELSYAADFFGSLFDGCGKAFAHFRSALKRVQDHLGALNDLAVARERLLIEAALKQPKIAFAAGRITGRSERDEPALLRTAAADFKRFHSAARFWRKRG